MRSSIRASVTRLLVIVVRFSACFFISASHSLFSSSISNISASALITVMGVLSSWLADVMNSFCLRCALAIGITISFEANIRTRSIIPIPTHEPSISESAVFLTSSIILLRSTNIAIVRFSFSYMQYL